MFYMAIEYKLLSQQLNLKGSSEEDFRGEGSRLKQILLLG